MTSLSRFTKLDPPGPLKCSCCGELKEFECFPPRRGGKRFAVCRECNNERRKQRRHEKELRSPVSKPMAQRRVVKNYKQWLETWRKHERSD